LKSPYYDARSEKHQTLHKWFSPMLIDRLFYRMGHEKVARLPFCTCPCDILSGLSM